MTESNKQPPILNFPTAIEALPPKKKGLRYLWLYALGLFTLAIVLMLLSFLSQTKREGQNALSDAQAQHNLFSVSALQSLDKMQRENAELREQVNEDLITRNTLLEQMADLRDQLGHLVENNNELYAEIAALEQQMAVLTKERDSLVAQLMEFAPEE